MNRLILSGKVRNAHPTHRCGLNPVLITNYQLPMTNDQ